MKPKKFSIADRIKSFSFAVTGIVKLFKREHNARIHLAAICMVVPLGWYLNLSKTEWGLLIIVMSLVVVTELLNTAIESVCDLIEPNHNINVEDAKDYAAGATLIAAIAAMLIGCILFLPKMWVTW